MTRSEEYELPTFTSPKGRCLQAMQPTCDHCGKAMTKEELASVDAVLPEIEATVVYVLECGACTATRDCPDEEYLTDLRAVADQTLADAIKRETGRAD